MPKHRYDNPDLQARDFLLAVMHDRHTPLSTRIDMAARILKLDAADAGLHDAHPNDREVRVIFRIEGLGNNPPELLPREPEAKVQVN
jgi:hypothetical protein